MKKLLTLSHSKSLGAAVGASLLSVFVLAAPACAQQAEATAVLPEISEMEPNAVSRCHRCGRCRQSGGKRHVCDLRQV